MAGKLFQEFIVDSWASTEQARLNYIRDHQADIRSDTYRGLADAVAADPNVQGQEIVRAGSEDLPDSVMVVYNHRSVVNDQGADPLSTP